MDTQTDNWQTRAYCWIGSARYRRPLDETPAKKWRALADGIGVKMYVVSLSAGYRPRRFYEHAHFYLLPELPGSILRYLMMFTFAPIIVLWLIFRHDVNVLIAQSPQEGAIGALAKGISRLFGRRVRLIVESHGDFENALFLYRRVFLSRVLRALMGVAARYALRNADALRSISQATHDQLVAYAPNKPIVRFITWTDAESFSNTKRGITLLNTRDIVFAGVLIPLKGVHFLLDAFAQLDMPDSTLYLIGEPINATYAEQLHLQVEQLGISRRVRFIRKVSQSELAHYMARTRVMVLPSLSEGLGRVVVEAMLCGTPVVASRVGGIPDMITDGENGYLVPPGDVDALAEALRKVMTDDNIEEMGAWAKAVAMEFFSPEAYVNGYRRLFEAVKDGESKTQASA